VLSWNSHAHIDDDPVMQEILRDGF